MFLWEVQILKKIVFCPDFKIADMAQTHGHARGAFVFCFLEMGDRKIEKSQKDGDGNTAGKGMAEQFLTAMEDRRGFQMRFM